jgi:hypothetical protein
MTQRSVTTSPESRKEPHTPDMDTLFKMEVAKAKSMAHPDYHPGKMALIDAPPRPRWQPQDES